MRLPAAVALLVVLATVVGAVAAHRPAADGGSDDIRVDYGVSLSRTSDALRVTAEVALPSDVAEFEFEPPAAATVLGTSGFREGGDELAYRWDTTTRPPRITYRIEPGDTYPETRFAVSDGWAFLQKRIVEGGASWRYSGSQPRFVETVDLASGARGFVGHGFVLLGDYSTRTRTVDRATLRLAVPESASMRADADAVFDALAFARRTLDVGHRHDRVTGFVHPTAIRLGGYALQGAPPEFVVNEAERPQGVRHAWFHEYVHTRQNFTTTDEMAWLFEASATYEAALLAIQHGNATWDDFQTTATTDRYAHVDLRTTGDGHTSPPNYRKGAAVVAVLDRRIRRATGGDRSFETVLERLNGRAEPVDSATFATVVSDVVGRPVADEIRRLVTTRIDPPPPDDPFLYTTGPDADNDRDGLTTTQERRAGTHPFEPDTDGDGLPDGRDVDLEPTATETSTATPTETTTPTTAEPTATATPTDAGSPTPTTVDSPTATKTDETERTPGGTGPVPLGPLLALAVALALVVRLVRPS